MKISKRLKTIASFISPGSFFADIGTDHAYLPCYVCLHDNNARAIAGEVAEGPYQSAYETVKSYGLNHNISVRLGNGLEVIKDDSITELVIAGMGGSLISHILENGKQHLKTVQKIITQPNIGEYHVRKWFDENGFIITNERILKENGRIYEIIVADKNATIDPYQEDRYEKQLFFGPLLLKEKSPIFHEKWSYQFEKQQDIIQQMNQAKTKNKSKLNRFMLELEWIEEVLHNEQ